MEQMNYEDFAGDFGMWAERFKPFITSPDMFNIYQKLKQDARTHTIYPESDNTFRSFGRTIPNHVRVVWYLMDPYPGVYFKTTIPQATGIPMDCSNSPDGKMQASLIKFYQGMEDDLCIPVEKSLDLSYLLDQGVLLLNADLTVKKGVTGSHSGLWRPFQKFFLEEVMKGFTGLIYVFSGEKAQELEEFVNRDANYIITTEHPVAASYGQRKWNHQQVFSRINHHIEGNLGDEYKIMWNKDAWDDFNDDPPF